MSTIWLHSILDHALRETWVRYLGWEDPLEKGKATHSSILAWRMISVRFQGKPFNVTVIQVYAPTHNAEEDEVERFYEDLQDLLELVPKKDVLFSIGDWNA